MIHSEIAKFENSSETVNFQKKFNSEEESKNKNQNRMRCKNHTELNAPAFGAFYLFHL